MTHPPRQLPMPDPPTNLAYDRVVLRFVELKPGDTTLGFVPSYNFRIELADGTDVGFIHFRVGDTGHVKLYAGHIGFAVDPLHRGKGYALQACHAIGPFVEAVSQTVIITCDPDNTASKKTIEKLEAEFLDEVPVSPSDPHYLRGSRSKLRYRWTPGVRGDSMVKP